MLNIGEFARLGQVSPRMLRHYDEIGLLHPKEVDPSTGYRLYEVAQLQRLHRLLALRDLGFTLEQIQQMLTEEPSVEQLRGMLLLRQAQIEQGIAGEKDRLRRVEAQLRAIERSDIVLSVDATVKMTERIRLAESTGEAAGFGHENLNPVFKRIVPEILGHLGRCGVRPRMMVAWYEEPADDGSVVAHVGFDIGDQALEESDSVSVRVLPEIEVVSVIHRGNMESIEATYENLVRWIDDSGLHLAGASRELYLDWNDDDPDLSVTEIQMPVRR